MTALRRLLAALAPSPCQARHEESDFVVRMSDTPACTCSDAVAAEAHEIEALARVLYLGPGSILSPAADAQAA